MKITDEHLSAFLDAELSSAEMEAIREQLLVDESLADRLAELALVDELVSTSAKQIDAQPIPLSITALLNEEPSLEKASSAKTGSAKLGSAKAGSAKIVAFPLWKRVRRSLQQPVAIAASVALVFGFGMSILNYNTGLSDWSEIAGVLEVAPSGVEQSLAKGTVVKPRFTFKNHNDEYCRQFEVHDAQGLSENIACRQAGQWQIMTSIASTQKKAGDYQTKNTSGYQTASGGSAVDDVLEGMINGHGFNLQEEQAAIANSWGGDK